jgi:hypothetical protein
MKESIMKRWGVSLLVVTGLTLACGVPEEQFVTPLDDTTPPLIDRDFEEQIEIPGIANPDLDLAESPDMAIGQAMSIRDVIEMGFVPSLESMDAINLLPKYEMPIATRCTTSVCVDSAAAIAPDLNGEMRGWIQLAFGTEADLRPYERPSTTYVMVVNTSEDMRWGVEGGPGELTRDMLGAMVAELREDDRIAIITHGARTNLLVPFAKGSDAGLDRIIADIAGGGALSGDDAVDFAYELAAEAETERTQVMLFTNTRPSLDAFLPRMTRATLDGVGTTLFEMGIDFGEGFAAQVDEVAGATTHSIRGVADVDRVMTDRFASLADPVAHDVRALLGVASPNIEMGRIFGVQRTAGRAMGAEVANLFPGQEHRTLLVEVRGNVKEEMHFEGQLDFALPSGERKTESISIQHLFRDAGSQAEQLGVARAAVLANFADGASRAIEVYNEGDLRLATAIMERVAERFSADAFALNDAVLEADQVLGQELLRLMERGAPAL